MSGPFAVPSRETWQAEARRALKGVEPSSLDRVDADGLGVTALYAADDGVRPLFAPRAQDADGRAWDLRTLVEGDDPALVNAAVLTDLEGGAASVVLAGAVLADPEPLGRALAGVALELAPVALDDGLDGLDAANALAVVAKGSPRARLRFHMDPISAFAEAGGSPRPIAEHLTLAANTGARHAGAYPEATFFMASGRVVHEAGGSAAQELGFAAASAVAYVTAAIAAGLSTQRALAGTVLSVSVDAEYFDALAKVRALRLIWRSISRAFGTEAPATIEARSSRRMLSARDPWPNLLRLTAAGFAGAVGGADTVVLDGFTRALGHPDAFARRQARNTQLILMEEAHLGRVDDPAAGSWFLDARTRDLAQAGWAAFQAIQAEGGILAALHAGTIQARVNEARIALEATYRDGAKQIVGVTKFVDPDVRPTPVEVSSPARPADPETRTIVPLSPIRLSEPFDKETSA